MKIIKRLILAIAFIIYFPISGLFAFIFAIIGLPLMAILWILGLDNTSDIVIDIGISCMIGPIMVLERYLGI